MATTNISFDPALHANKESEAWQVLDLVLQQQIGKFSAVKIAQTAELLPSWVSRNVVALTKARADDTRDWYFPVYTRRAIPTHTCDRRTSSSWSGIHHWAEDEASASVHLLPPLPALPPSWNISTIVASAGGLLLLMPPIYPVPSMEDGEAVRPCRACGGVGSRHAQGFWMNSNAWGRTKSRLRYAESKVPQDWKPLLVCNPLTKAWRELPVAAENPNAVGGARNSFQLEYDEVLIDMIVDDEQQANSYTIVMTFRSSHRMCIYTSPSNTWVCHRYNPIRSPEMAWKSHICANAVFRERLHYAFLEYKLDAPTAATLHVFEIQLETGEWKPWKEYELWVSVDWDMVARRAPYIRGIQGRIERGASEALRCLALVECMEDMYAVIPTRLGEDVIICNNARVRWVVDDVGRQGYEVMPVQFNILALNPARNCENLIMDVDGVLQIQVPEGRSDLHLRRTSLLEKMSFKYSPLWNWFSCTARGSVIWVTCEDYVLQYDVVSKEPKTQIIRKPRLADAGVSYTPSFHVKP